MPSGTQTTTIMARPRWNETAIYLEAGAEYRLSATGTWYDGSIACLPDGYDSPNGLLRRFERFRRAPDEKWFALIGAIDRDIATLFRIGQSAIVRPSRSGLLTCFANDMWLMYFNNRGSVRLKVDRTEKTFATGPFAGSERIVAAICCKSGAGNPDWT